MTAWDKEDVSSDVTVPPVAPTEVCDYRDLAAQAEEIRAQEAARKQALRRRKKIIGIAASAAVVVLIVFAAVLFLFMQENTLLGERAEVSTNSQEENFFEQDADADDNVSDDTASDSDAYTNTETSESSDTSSSDEEVSAAEAAVATSSIRSAFTALSNDKDGIFTSFVEAFMEDYDSGVDTKTSYTFADLDIQPEELAEALLSDFSCSVSNIEIFNQVAWVTVEVSSKSLADQAEVFADAVESGAVSAEDEEAYRSLLKQEYLAAFDSISARTHSLVVTVDRDEGNWTVSDDVMEYILGSVWYTSA